MLLMYSVAEEYVGGCWVLVSLEDLVLRGGLHLISGRLLLALGAGLQCYHHLNLRTERRALRLSTSLFLT